MKSVLAHPYAYVDAIRKNFEKERKNRSDGQKKRHSRAMKIKFADVNVDRTISRAEVKAAEKVLEDNGIDPDEVKTVMQAVGYALLGAELYETEVRP